MTFCNSKTIIKAIGLLLSAGLTLGLCACNSNKATSASTSAVADSSAVVPSQDSKTKESSDTVSYESIVSTTVSEQDASSFEVLSAFRKIIERYKNAYDNDYFDNNIEKCGDINSELFMSGFEGAPLYYALVDLSSDGEPELFISAYSENFGGGYMIYDAYGYENGKPERLFDTKASMGYRAVYSLCANNAVKLVGSDSASKKTTEFFTLPEKSASPVSAAKISDDSGKFYSVDKDGKKAAISEDEAEKTIKKYPDKITNWITVNTLPESLY